MPNIWVSRNFDKIDRIRLNESYMSNNDLPILQKNWERKPSDYIAIAFSAHRSFAHVDRGFVRRS
jgi:hypothetical protein